MQVISRTHLTEYAFSWQFAKKFTMSHELVIVLLYKFAKLIMALHRSLVYGRGGRTLSFLSECFAARRPSLEHTKSRPITAIFFNECLIRFVHVVKPVRLAYSQQNLLHHLKMEKSSQYMVLNHPHLNFP